MNINLFHEQAPDDMAAAVARIPVIDVDRAFAEGGRALEVAAGAVRAACEEVGFFYVRGHGVSESVIEEAFAQSRRFHALPLEAANEALARLRDGRLQGAAVLMMEPG